MFKKTTGYESCGTEQHYRPINLVYITQLNLHTVRTAVIL